jgi:hypothetical protein
MKGQQMNKHKLRQLLPVLAEMATGAALEPRQTGGATLSFFLIEDGRPTRHVPFKTAMRLIESPYARRTSRTRETYGVTDVGHDLLGADWVPPKAPPVFVPYAAPMRFRPHGRTRLKRAKRIAGCRETAARAWAFA